MSCRGTCLALRRTSIIIWRAWRLTRSPRRNGRGSLSKFRCDVPGPHRSESRSSQVCSAEQAQSSDYGILVDRILQQNGFEAQDRLNRSGQEQIIALAVRCIKKSPRVLESRKIDRGHLGTRAL